MKRPLALLIVLIVALSGCVPPQPVAPQPEPEATTPTAPAAPPAPPAPPPALPGAAVDRPASELDELVAQLENDMNAPGSSPAAVVTALFEGRGIQVRNPNRMQIERWAEADLDGDGELETVTALNARHNSGGTVTEGRVFVIARRDGRLVPEPLEGGPVHVGGELREVSLHAVTDLTGDGRPEIVWVGQDAGAHTTYAHIYVTQWSPGQQRLLWGPTYMSFANLKIEGQEIVLSGGTVGSVGAGPLQRKRTDRYRWNGSAIVLVDRQYASSPLAYHRLQDGVVAETLNQPERAVQAYRDALEPNDGYGVPLDWQDRFAQAVHALARLRLGGLLLETGQPDASKKALIGTEGPYAGLVEAMALAGSREEGCRNAAAWAMQQPEFVQALNSPYGYNNPEWSAEKLCGPLPATR